MVICYPFSLYIHTHWRAVSESVGVYQPHLSRLLWCFSPVKSCSFFLSGIFTFEGANQRVSESVGVMEVKVLRTSGARGLVAVPYRTVDATAKAGEDYELAAGKLEFQNDETM